VYIVSTNTTYNTPLYFSKPTKVKSNSQVAVHAIYNNIAFYKPTLVSFGHKDDDKNKIRELLRGKQFVTASNRGAIYIPPQNQFSESQKTDPLTNPNGGVRDAINKVMHLTNEGIWVSCSGCAKGIENKEEWKPIVNPQLGINRPYTALHINLDEKTQHDYYTSISSEVIWPLFHITDDEMDIELYSDKVAQPTEKAWGNYKKVNKTFANKILQKASSEKENVFWVHDYLLMLTPAYIREQAKNENKNCRFKIGYFHHIPFPKTNILLKNMGEEKSAEIVSGILCSDFAGFHTTSYANNFINTVQTLHDKGYLPEIKNIDCEKATITMKENNRICKVSAIPINISAEEIAKTAHSKETTAKMAEIQGKIKKFNTNSKHLLFSVERGDYSKNLLVKLEAFDKYLENLAPAARREITYVMAFTPARKVDIDRDKYDAYKNASTPEERIKHNAASIIKPPSAFTDKAQLEYYKQVLKKIDNINKKYYQLDKKALGQGSFMPIYYLNGIHNTEKFAFMRLSDVLINTPASDGMNLITQEVITSKNFAKNDKPVKIILSTTPGIACNTVYTNNSFTTSPFNTNALSKLMSRAITEVENEPEKVQKENINIANDINTHDVSYWAEKNIEKIITA